MNLYHLRYFVTLAYLEHYTKAAEILCITQPSLTYAIKSLEDELGVKLFEKDGRNVLLTKYGRSFLTDVKHSLDILDASVNNLQLTGKGEGELDIAMLRTLSTRTIPGFVKSFLDQNPQKNISFKFHNSTGLSIDIIQGLKDRKYDIAFCSFVENEPLVDFVPVAKQDLVLITPLDHPLASKDEIHLEESIPYPQIFFSKKSGIRPSIDQLFDQCKGKPNVVNYLAEDESIAGLVGIGFGVAVVPDMDILDHLPVKKIAIKKPTVNRLFYMATLKDVFEAPLVLNFKSHVLKNADL